MAAYPETVLFFKDWVTHYFFSSAKLLLSGFFPTFCFFLSSSTDIKFVMSACQSILLQLLSNWQPLALWCFYDMVALTDCSHITLENSDSEEQVGACTFNQLIWRMKKSHRSERLLCCLPDTFTFITPVLTDCANCYHTNCRDNQEKEKPQISLCFCVSYSRTDQYFLQTIILSSPDNSHYQMFQKTCTKQSQNNGSLELPE